MQLIQSSLQRNFTIKHNGKIYYVDYLNSDGQILGLSNRDYWEVLDEELENIDDYENKRVFRSLIKFCIKHFNDYQPDYKEDF